MREDDKLHRKIGLGESGELTLEKRWRDCKCRLPESGGGSDGAELDPSVSDRVLHRPY